MDEPKKPLPWVRLYRFLFGRHKIATIIIAVSAILAIGLNIYLFFVYDVSAPAKPKDSSQKLVKEIVPPTKYYSTLTGLEVANEAALTSPATAIMIENSPEARPQSGLKDAEVVFEAIAEGGITRFMAIYQTAKPQLIGPVRSVRPYYLSWAAAFDASIGHIGGSAAALEEVRNGAYRDIDQFFNSDTYWRSADRYAPHNVYTSFANIDALNAAKGYTSSTFTGFSHADSVAIATPTASNIEVTISSYLFNSSYVYNAAANNYARSEGGEPHLDREAGQITPSVVIVMYVDEFNMSDSRQDITTVGSGNAVIFQNGTIISATWTKNSKTEQLRFTDSVGAEIPLECGQVWITAIPNNGGDVIWS